MASHSLNSAVNELTSDHLAVLCNALNDVAPKCLELGLQLGVRRPIVDIIMKNNKNDCQAQLREIISERLKQGPLTWHNIVKALISPSVDHPDVARDILSWYKSSSLDLQQHPFSDSEQHLSLGRERPYLMLMMDQTRVSEIPSRDRMPVPTSSLCGACLRCVINFSCLCCQRRPQHGENSQPPTQMMHQTPVREPPHGENSQPPSLMMGHTPLRGPPCGENFHPLQMMGQTQVRGPPHGESYQSSPQIIGQTPVRRPPCRENYQPPSANDRSNTSERATTWGELPAPHINDGSDNSDGTTMYQPFALMRGSSYLYLPHHITPNQTAHPNTPSITQSYPSVHTQSSSTTADHRSPMDIFVHYVKSTYKQCEIEKNLNVVKWPPTPSKIFINLACIDWESVVCKEEADEYTRAMVEDGNVDVIMKEKRNINFDDIVQYLSPVTTSEKVVLVEGAPGVGKSTFAWEFCRRWERGDIAQQYQLVLLLRLRDAGICSAKSLRDLIYHSSESVHRAVVDELESTFGVNTLIILEGFDELPASQRKDSSIFLQLIIGKLLLHATVMITSRPWATGALLAQFKHRIFLHVEILGFTEENITKYVTSVFTGEGKKTATAIEQSPGEVSEEAKVIDDVMAYIGKYPQIKACMYIPLNAAIVVSIYRESMKSKWVPPTTLTELYQALTQILLLRYLRGHAEYSHQQWSVESLEDVPRQVHSQLIDISKIAYDGICRESYGEEAIKLIFSDIPDDFETLGLMQSVSQLFMYGQKTSHNFLHLTFQEFLAAYLISTMSPAKQLEHFQRHEDGRLRVVLRFLAGLTKLNTVTSNQLISLLGDPTVKQSDEHRTQYFNPMRPDVCVSAHHTNWLFEAQNSELLQSLFHNHTASFTFTRAMLLLEYFSVGYCIAHSHTEWSLTFDEDTEEEKLHMLVSGAETADDHRKFKVTLKTISTCMTPEKMHIILNGLSPCVKKFYLKIPDNGNFLSLPPSSTLRILELQIDSTFPFNISCDLSFSSLEVLIISSSFKSTTLGANTYKAIGKLLSSSTSLKEFHLSLNIWENTYVSNNGMEVITKCLSDNTALPLKSLGINCNCTFTVTATRSLVQFITKSTALQYLKILIDTFGDVDIFAKGLSDNIPLSLKTLDIECKCTFTTTATRSLVQFITKSTTLQCFKICIDTFKDIDIFVKGLNANVSLPLKSLVIDCKCTFTTTATRSLVQFITRSTTLHYIKICRITISAQALIKLTEAIHHCFRLQVKLKQLTFCVECAEDVVNLRHMIKDHPDMLKCITDWDGVTNIHSFSIRCSNEMKASLVSLGVGCSRNTSLNLMNMRLNDAVVVILARALHHNTTLKELYLSNNCISDAGAVALAQALHHNSTLEVLSLPANDAIGREGTHQLLQALTVNTSITKGGLILPKRCEHYATQHTEQNTGEDRIWFC